jgi:hypothetical protein
MFGKGKQSSIPKRRFTVNESFWKPVLDKYPMY